MKPETLRKIQRLATHGATKGEREAAQETLSRLREKYGDAPADEPTTATAVVGYQNAWQKELLVHTAVFLDCSAHKVTKEKKVRRKIVTTTLKQIAIRGEAEAVAFAEVLYKHHRSQILKHMDVFANSYCHSAMPVSEAVKSKAKTIEIDSSDPRVESMRAGVGVGQKNVVLFPTKRLGDARQSEAMQ